MGEHADLLELSDHAWRRLRDRLSGLTDDEYRWQPGVTTLRWRLQHICEFLRESRNADWLGVGPAGAEVPAAADAAHALTELAESYAVWRAVLLAVPEPALAEPIGPVAGPFGTASRRAFVHHVIDELVHHGAEVALLRDLWAAR